MTTRFASLSLALVGVVWMLASCANGTAQTTSTGDDSGLAFDASASSDAGADAAADCPTTCTGTKPFCDPKSHECVQCLPSNDTCPGPTYCNAMNQCVAGCKTNADCTQGDGGALACCGHACVDTTSSAAHCGMCGHSCSAGDGGVAACCSSQCVDTNASAANCGGCGHACMAQHVSNATCAMATCGFDTCWPGYGDCDSNKANGCETPTSADPMRCGGCNSVCSRNHISNPTCAASVCNGTCDTGYADCNSNKLIDGCETSTDTDPLHCGSCGTACSNNHIMTPACTQGTCSGACDVGYSDCNLNKAVDGCEVATATDPQNCGGCGNVCSNANITTPTCAAGVCNGACNTGFGDCNNNKLTDGCERALNTLTDCGGCGVACSPANASGATCASLTCNYGACTGTFQDCDNNRGNGCESNKNTDNANCGSCGNRCTGNTACYNGACVSNRVLIAAAELDATLTTLQTQLNGTGAFSVVDVINTQNSTPTVAQMQQYSVVMSWSDYGGGQNEQLFYDNLATYYDGGGRVVLAVFIVGGYPGGAVGRFLQPGNGYMLFNVTQTNNYTSAGAQTLGTVFEPASTLMAGVTTVTDSAGWASNEPLLPGTTVVANWSGGRPMIVRGQAQGRNRVDLNMWPNMGNLGGNAITVIKNALLYQ